jgi:hypothetical protein
MKTLAKSFVGILCVLAFAASSAGAVTVNVLVDSQAMPWLTTPPPVTPPFTGLNYPFFFYGLQDGKPPTIVDASQGFSFAPGGAFTISYLNGFTSPYGGFGGGTFGDGNGLNGVFSSFKQPTKYYDSYPFVYNSPGLGNYYPTLYTFLGADPASEYYLGCLVGTFADSSGTIAGMPFFIGDGPVSVTVPVGATRLQLGINDDLFSDNRGILLVEVTGPGNAPIPTTTLLFGSGLLGLVGWRRFRKS